MIGQDVAKKLFKSQNVPSPTNENGSKSSGGGDEKKQISTRSNKPQVYGAFNNDVVNSTNDSTVFEYNCKYTL